jgi:hypothetical protein
VIRVAATLVVFVALVSVGSARSEPRAAETTTTNRVVFADARGENASGVDISRVVVSSTSAGDIVFRVEIPTNATFVEGMRVRVWIDADGNPATGHEGVDYFLLADDDVAALYSCANPPTCDVFDQSSTRSFRFSYREGATFKVDRRYLGNTKRFRFFAAAYEGIVQKPGKYDLSNARYDFAPREGGWWTFDTSALDARSFSVTPATPRAGKSFVLRLAAARTSTGALVTSGKVSCSLRIGGRAVKTHTSGFVGHRALCAYDVRSDAKGKRYRATISIRVGPYTIARALSGRVR